MGAPQQILLAPGGGGVINDPYWANVTLLLEGLGSNGSTTILDSSSLAHTVSIVGSLVNISTTSPPSGMTSSIQSQGSGGLSIADHTGFDFGSGDFTCEMYFYELSGVVFPVLLGKSATVNFAPVQMLTSLGRDIFTRSSNDGSSYGASVTAAAPAYSQTTWYHLAWGRTGTTFYSWLDGVSLGTATMSGALTTNSDPLVIMTGGSGGNFWNGRISSVRLTKGVNRYTTAFTPPPLPLPTS